MTADLGQFQTSASYVNAMARALQKLGQLDAVIARADAPTAQMLRAPNAASWWGPPESFGMVRAVDAVGGAELLQQVGRLAVFESLSAIVRPLVGVLLAISGPSPASLLSRFGQLTQAAIKGVHFEWKETSKLSGELTVTYPIEVPPGYVPLWLGAFDFVWDTTKRQGTTRATHTGKVLHFAVSWS